MEKELKEVAIAIVLCWVGTSRLLNSGVPRKEKKHKKQ